MNTACPMSSTIFSANSLGEQKTPAVMHYSSNACDSAGADTARGQRVGGAGEAVGSAGSVRRGTRAAGGGRAGGTCCVFQTRECREVALVSSRGARSLTLRRGVLGSSGSTSSCHCVTSSEPWTQTFYT